MKITFVIMSFLWASGVFANCPSIKEDISKFVLQKISVSKECLWDAKYVELSLTTGFERLCQINPELINGIVKKSLTTDLHVKCDVSYEEPNNYPYFSYSQSTIHMWKGSEKVMRTQSTIFHEFLHYIGLPYDDEIHNGDKDLESDPVYACHVSAYPEVAGKILGNENKLSAAKKTCGRKVEFCDSESFNICWITFESEDPLARVFR